MSATRSSPKPQVRQAEREATRSVQRLARAGLVGRAFFYGMLAYLAARLAAVGRVGHQADAAGALGIVTGTWPGRVAAAVAAAGFVAFGGLRLRAALRDRRPKGWQRAITALQGAFYLGLAYVPISFLLGDHNSGSEQAQRSQTATLLRAPGGPELVIALGAVVLLVSGWQVRTAARQDYTAGMREPRSAVLRAAVRVAGTAGIAARALVFGPLGAFLIAAGATRDPGRAKGLDGELLDLARQWWGRPVLGLVTAGLVVFTGYSLLEARYRDLTAGR